MQCPVGGCDNVVESGPNCYVEVETGIKSKRKLVCEECAEMFMEHIS